MFTTKIVIGILIIPVFLCNKKYDLLWMAPFFSGGGYCSEAIEFAKAINTTDINLITNQHGDSFNMDFAQDLSENTLGLIMKNSKKKVHPLRTITVCHSEPGAWQPALYSTTICPPEGKTAVNIGSAYKIGRTMFETDRIPDGWLKRLQSMDEVRKIIKHKIWVPSQFAFDIFNKGGVDTDKLKIIGEPIDTVFYNPDLYKPIVKKKKREAFIFGSVFKWEKRKGWDVLIEAYSTLFNREYNVVLYLLLSAYHTQDDFDIKIKEFLKKKNIPVANSPQIKIFSKLSDTEVCQFYKSIDVLIQPSRGEGWGRPHVEAMSMKVPVIATIFGGTATFLNEENGFPISCERMVEIGEGAFASHKWCEPKLEELKEKMLYVFNNRQVLKAKGEKARYEMESKYSIKKYGEIMKEEYNRIVHELNKKETEL